MMEPTLAGRHDDTITVTPWTVIVQAILWFSALEVAASWRRIGLFVAAGVGVLLIAAVVWQWRKRWATNVAAIATTLIAITSVAVLTFVPGGWQQHTVAVMSVALLWFVGRQRLRLHDDLRGRTMAFVTAVLVWFSWFSLLSASIYLNLNVLWLVVGAGVMTAASAVLVWTESGLLWRQYRWGVLIMTWFGAVLFVATWWLPTSLLVNSTISTTVVALVIQATRHLWKGHWEAGRSRRYVLIGVLIILLVLLTARWI